MHEDENLVALAIWLVKPFSGCALIVFCWNPCLWCNCWIMKLSQVRTRLGVESWTFATKRCNLIFPWQVVEVDTPTLSIPDGYHPLSPAMHVQNYMRRSHISSYHSHICAYHRIKYCKYHQMSKHIVWENPFSLQFRARKFCGTPDLQMVFIGVSPIQLIIKPCCLKMILRVPPVKQINHQFGFAAPGLQGWTTHATTESANAWGNRFCQLLASDIITNGADNETSNAHSLIQFISIFNLFGSLFIEYRKPFFETRKFKLFLNFWLLPSRVFWRKKRSVTVRSTGKMAISAFSRTNSCKYSTQQRKQLRHCNKIGCCQSSMFFVFCRPKKPWVNHGSTATPPSPARQCLHEPPHNTMPSWWWPRFPAKPWAILALLRYWKETCPQLEKLLPFQHNIFFRKTKTKSRTSKPNPA